METPKEYHYVYYSYEEYGRGYIGSRTCKCLPEEDAKYFGSFKDKTFKPTQKIILKDDYATREEAYADEIILQRFYKVVENQHFANKSYQSSTKFYYIFPTEQRREYSKKSGKIGGQKNKELGLGICGLSIEERRKNVIKSIETNMKNKTAIFAQTPEQLSENGKKAAETNRKNGTGLFGLSAEQRSENGKKNSAKNKENKVGIFALTTEQLVENAKKGGAISSKIINAQRWECCETGYVSTAAGIVVYQRARGIDTSKSNRRRIA